MAKIVSTRIGSSSGAKGSVPRGDAPVAAGRPVSKEREGKGKALAKAADAEAAQRRRDRKQALVYTVVGRTFDGVDVLKPKLKSTHFEPGEARRLFEDLLGDDGIEQIVRASQAAADKG